VRTELEQVAACAERRTVARKHDFLHAVIGDCNLERLDERVAHFDRVGVVALGAIEILTSEVRRYQEAGVSVDWLIPHQANLTRILHPACDTLGIPRERLCASFERTGNTSSASIPLLLDELRASGRAKPGDNVVMVGFGASFSIGSALIVVA
jgi:3-oxoacyl-[acyl-carrier-protein] synthase III